MKDYAAIHRDGVISRAFDDWRMNRITADECQASIDAANAAYDEVFA
jgi:hypothetical protein